MRKREYALGRKTFGGPVVLLVKTRGQWFEIEDCGQPVAWATVPYDIGRYCAGTIRLAWSLLNAHFGPDLANLLAEEFAFANLCRAREHHLHIGSEELEMWVVCAAFDFMERAETPWDHLDREKRKAVPHGEN